MSEEGASKQQVKGQNYASFSSCDRSELLQYKYNSYGGSTGEALEDGVTELKLGFIRNLTEFSITDLKFSFKPDNNHKHDWKIN